MNANETTTAERIDEQMAAARRDARQARNDAIRLLRKVAAAATRDADRIEADPENTAGECNRLDSYDRDMVLILDRIARSRAAMDLLAYLSGAKT